MAMRRKAKHYVEGYNAGLADAHAECPYVGRKEDDWVEGFLHARRDVEGSDKAKRAAAGITEARGARSIIWSTPLPGKGSVAMTQE